MSNHTTGPRHRATTRLEHATDQAWQTLHRHADKLQTACGITAGFVAGAGLVAVVTL